MDELRARAYLDLLLDKDSRPAAPADGTTDTSDTTDTSGTTDGTSDTTDTSGTTDGGGGNSGGSGSGNGSGGESGSGGPAGGPRTGGSGPPPPVRPDPAGPVTAPGAGVRPSGFAGRLHLTVPLTTLLGLADRPGEIPGLGPVDPWLARDLARAAAANPKTTWCLTVTDGQGHAIGHGCARPAPGNQRDRPAEEQTPGRPADPGRRIRPARPAGTARGSPSRPQIKPGRRADTDPGGSPPGFPGSGTWHSRWTRSPPGAVITGSRRLGMTRAVKLRHLAQIRHLTCTAPTCRRPAAQADFEHNVAYEAGGRTCLCNGGPPCKC